jgi:hypothetical protein
MTTHAPRRSRGTTAESASHVQVMGDREASMSPLVKIQGLTMAGSIVTLAILPCPSRTTI